MNKDSAFPLLVADIGGTNVRFGWVASLGAPLSAVESLACADFTGPNEAAASYLARLHGGTQPQRAAIAIASAIGDGPIKMTNSNWVLDRTSFQRAIGAATLDVFNDFEAIALLLPHLNAADTRRIASPAGRDVPISTKPKIAAPMAVIGPGTGLGVAGIIPVRARPGTWQTICGEGGHVTLSGATDYQNAILAAARKIHPHVSAERLVSGIGLPTLRRAIATVENIAAGDDLSAEEIGNLGVTGEDALAKRTLEAFCGFLGCIAGNLALTLGARGGVFIAGGIVPKLAPLFAQSGFREHFEAKGRYREYLQEIATFIITAPHPGLMGLVHHADSQTWELT